MRHKHAQQWTQADNAKKLNAFVKWMARESNSAEYERRKAQWTAPDDGLDSLFGD